MTPKFYLFHLILRYKISIAATIVILLLFCTQIGNRYYFISREYIPEPIDVVYTWVNGSDPRFQVSLEIALHDVKSKIVDSSPQRFDDKYEMKFSLRSLEKYAPWIRHVYIVTNGQIPYWLNLDYEGVTVVTHEEIFSDLEDLPTFSSPAIEANIHRIPGVSKRFIYFNDDMLLGAPVYLEDLSSINRGHLLYLTWPVAPCAFDCPWMYVNDGQCDNQCYNPACQMDGGDCTNEAKDEKGNIINAKPNLVETDYLGEDNLNAITRPTINESSHHSTTPNVIETPLLLRMLKTGNLTPAAVDEHNKRFIKDDKLRRKKLKFRRSKFIEKLKYAGKTVASTFEESLQHTNRLLNNRYGFRTRYVAAHSPLLVDVGIMEDLQSAFAEEFLITARNKLRSGDDVQYGLMYYYYLLEEKADVSIGEIFDGFDTDGSGCDDTNYRCRSFKMKNLFSTWSDREIRTILTKLYELPLSYAIVDHFEAILTNCSSQGMYVEVSTPEFERYIDSKLPTISKEMVVECTAISAILKASFGSKSKYKTEVLSNESTGDVTFRMLTSNISEVVGHLDVIRRKPTKFICLNDNLEPARHSDNELIRSVLYDFYLSLFPTPSKFELPPEFRNRFLYMDELADWKRFHFRLKTMLLCVFLVFLYICVFRLYRKRFVWGPLHRIC